MNIITTPVSNLLPILQQYNKKITTKSIHLALVGLFFHHHQNLNSRRLYELMRWLNKKFATLPSTSNVEANLQKGVYVISKDLDDTHHKIGMAHGSGGLFNRLKSYKICWPYPKEYYPQYLFICNSTNAKLLEKKILARTDKLKQIEKAEDVGEEKDEGRHSLEWRFTGRKTP